MGDYFSSLAIKIKPNLFKRFVIATGLLASVAASAAAFVGSPVFRPGGTDGQIQYNSNGRFGGVSVTTNTLGDITSVNAGAGLTGGATVGAATLAVDNTKVIFSTNVLQSGTTAYPAFLQVGSSATVYGRMAINAALGTGPNYDILSLFNTSNGGLAGEVGIGFRVNSGSTVTRITGDCFSCGAGNEGGNLSFYVAGGGALPVVPQMRITNSNGIEVSTTLSPYSGTTLTLGTPLTSSSWSLLFNTNNPTGTLTYSKLTGFSLDRKLTVSDTITASKGITSSTATLTTIAPGVLHTIATSSDVVSALVSLSSEVTGVLPLANMAPGASYYIQNVSSLQSGATAFPDFLYIGSSVTLKATTVSDLTASLPVKTDANKKLTAAAITLSGSEVTGILPLANMTPNATYYVQNKNSLQSGATAFPDFLYIGSSATLKAATISDLTASLPVKTDTNSKLTAAAISLAGSEVTGILPLANITPNATYYVQNKNSLQSGATAYPDFLYIGSSATLKAATVSDLTASLPVKTDANKKLTAAAISLAGSEVTGVLPLANMSPGATYYVQNTNTLQTGSTFYVSSGTVNGNFYTRGTVAGSILSIFQGAASQTASVLEAQNSSGVAYVKIGPDTLPGNSATVNFLNITGTMPTTMSALTFGIAVNITGAGSSAQISKAMDLNYLAGYTGASRTIALGVDNLSAGTGAILLNGADIGATANCGINAFADATTAGTNVGNFNEALGGNVNVGVMGKAIGTKNSATNVAVFGAALNAGTSPIQVGGFFGLMTADPTFASAALMADNGSQTSDIFVARDNGTPKFTIADGGAVTAVSSATFNGTVVISSGVVAGTSTATAGFYLQAKGVGQIPQWVPDGLILGSSQAITTAQTSTSGTAYVGTTSSVTYTMRSTTSAIHIEVSGDLASNSGTVGTVTCATVYRDGNNIFGASGYHCIEQPTAGLDTGYSAAPVAFDDYPGYSPVTYAVYIKTKSGVTTAQWCSSGSSCIILVKEIGKSP